MSVALAAGEPINRLQCQDIPPWPNLQAMGDRVDSKEIRGSPVKGGVMKRHPVLLLTVMVAMIALAALGAPKKPGLLLLDWATRSSTEPPPVAILIEMGLKDERPRSGSHRP